MDKFERKRRVKPSSINKKNSFLKKSAKLSAQQTISRKRVHSSMKNNTEQEKSKVGKQSASHGILKRPKEVTLQEKSRSVDPSTFTANFIPLERYELAGSGEKMEKKKSSSKNLQKKVSYAKTEKDSPDQSEVKHLPEVKEGVEDTSRHYKETSKSKRWVKEEIDLDKIDYDAHKTASQLSYAPKTEKRDAASKRPTKLKSKPKEKSPRVSPVRSKTTLKTPIDSKSNKHVHKTSNEPLPSRKTQSVTSRDTSKSMHNLPRLPSKHTDRTDSTDFATSRISSRKTIHSGTSQYSAFSSDSSLSDTQEQEVEMVTPSKHSNSSSLCLGGRRNSWIPPRSVASALRYEAIQKSMGTETSSDKTKSSVPRMSLQEFYDDLATQRSFFGARAPSTIGNYAPPASVGGMSLHNLPEVEMASTMASNDEDVSIGSKSFTANNYFPKGEHETKNKGNLKEEEPRHSHSGGDTNTSTKSGTRPFVYNKSGRVSLSPSFTYFSTIHTTHKKCRVHNTYTGPLRYQFRFRSPRPCLCRAHPSKRERSRELYSRIQTQQKEKNPQPPKIAQRYSHTYRFKRPLTQESGQPSNFFFIGTESLMAPDRYRGPVSRVNQLVKYPTGYMIPKNTETLWARDVSLSRRTKIYSRSSNESVAGSTEIASTDDPDSDFTDVRGYDLGGQSVYGLRGTALKWLDQVDRR